MQLLRSTLRRSRSTILGVTVAAFAVLALYRIGFVDDYGNTLQVMGFDPDRAALLTSLLVGATAAVVVTLAGGWFGAAVVAGVATLLIGFYPVFRRETRAALGSTGADGRFDPLGWLASSLTLMVVGVIAGWAAAVLARDVRRRAQVLWGATADLAGARLHSRADVGRLAGGFLALALLLVTLPVFGDMLNFEPDAHMRSGAQPGLALFGGPDAGGPAASAAGPGGPGYSAGPGSSTASGTILPVASEPLIVPSDLVRGPIPGSAVTANALATIRPWAANPPAGGGRVFSVNVPAPWTGGIRDYATLDVYLPPGYDTGTRQYPVIYEPHQPLWAWNQGMHAPSLLDTLIRTAVIPPEIVVFVGQYGGPYADSECADSWDGREWFDRYLGHDVPAWIDAHLRTIPTPAARSLLGFSSGGYCAAAAIAHHPDVFGSAVIFSGYFEAGIRTTTTPNAGRPFNDDPALEARVSPIDVIPHLPLAQRHAMFIAFSADPANRFYGDQITKFAGVLDAAGVPMAILPTPLGHSWAAVREQLPAMLSILAARQVQLGVFGTP